MTCRTMRGVNQNMFLVSVKVFIHTYVRTALYINISAQGTEKLKKYKPSVNQLKQVKTSYLKVALLIRSDVAASKG